MTNFLRGPALPAPAADVGDVVQAGSAGGPLESRSCGGGDHRCSTRNEITREIRTCSSCGAQWVRTTAKIVAGNLVPVRGSPWVVVRTPKEPTPSETQDRTRTVLRSIGGVVPSSYEELDKKRDLREHVEEIAARVRRRQG